MIDKIPTNITGKFLKRTLKSMFPWPQVHGLYSISEKFHGFRGMRTLLHDIRSDGYVHSLSTPNSGRKSLIVLDSEILLTHPSVMSLSALDSVIILVREHNDVSVVEKSARRLADSGVSVSIVCSSTSAGNLFSLGLSMQCEMVFCLGELADSNTAIPAKTDLSEVIQEVFNVLGDIGMEEDPENICIDESLATRGVTSSHSAVISEKLHKSFKVDLPATIIFDYPTVKSIAKYVLSLVNDMEVEPLTSLDSGVEYVESSGAVCVRR